VFLLVNACFFVIPVKFHEAHSRDLYGRVNINEIQLAPTVIFRYDARLNECSFILYQVPILIRNWSL
jgi:hypothetical protein